MRKIDWDIPTAPELLRADEAEALAKRALAGDRAARDALILGCWALVVTHVKRLLRRHGDALFGLSDGGDLHSAGLEGLVEGVVKMSNTANVLAYLTKCIRHEIADQIKRHARQPARPLSDFPRLDREDSSWPRPWKIEDAIAEVTKDSWDRAKDRELLRLRWEGHTYAEISARTGVKQSTVGRRIRQYEKKMRSPDAADGKSGQDKSLKRIEEDKPNTRGETPMDPTLKAFVEANTFRRPDARIKLCDLVGRFRSTLSGREVKLWPRWRFAKELEAGGYVLGKDSDRVVFVVGLSFQAPRQWTVDEGGRLRLTEAVA